jgi:hypothetical protein
MARPNWSRPLPRPLVIPKVMTLATLGDVRTLIAKHLPAHFRGQAVVATRRCRTRQGRGRRLCGGFIDRLADRALSLDGVECRAAAAGTISHRPCQLG